MIDYIALYTYAFIVTLTPGPNNLISMACSGSEGFKKSLGLRLGMVVGFSIIMLSTSTLNIVLANTLPVVLPYLKYIGAVYIGYLILKINNVSFGSKKEDNTLGFTFMDGMMLQLANPKVIIYGFTIFSMFIIQHEQRILPMVLFSLSFTLIGFTSVTTWALIGSKLNSVIAKYPKTFRFIMSTGLIYTILTILDLL